MVLGVEKAKKDFVETAEIVASKGHKVYSVVPERVASDKTKNQKFDFNDLNQQEGVKALRSQIDGQLGAVYFESALSKTKTNLLTSDLTPDQKISIKRKNTALDFTN